MGAGWLNLFRKNNKNAITARPEDVGGVWRFCTTGQYSPVGIVTSWSMNASEEATAIGR